MQATVASFDPDSGSGSVLTDDGRRVAFDPAAFAAGGLRLLRPGQRVRMEVNRRVRRGWFQDEAGTTHFILRVGGKPMPLQPGKAAIGIGTLDKLPAIIDALINAVRAGELDAQIKEAAVARGLMIAERRKKAV